MLYQKQLCIMIGEHTLNKHSGIINNAECLHHLFFFLMSFQAKTYSTERRTRQREDLNCIVQSFVFEAQYLYY
jgi:hypothetical protein